MHTLFVYACVFGACCRGQLAANDKNPSRPQQTPAVPYVIMANFSNKNADLLNVVNKNRKLAAWHDGTPLK